MENTSIEIIIRKSTVNTEINNILNFENIELANNWFKEQLKFFIRNEQNNNIFGMQNGLPLNMNNVSAFYNPSFHNPYSNSFNNISQQQLACVDTKTGEMYIIKITGEKQLILAEYINHMERQMRQQMHGSNYLNYSYDEIMSIMEGKYLMEKDALNKQTPNNLPDDNQFGCDKQAW